MRRVLRWSWLLPWTAAALVLALALDPGARAGGPLYVFGLYDEQLWGEPYLWDTAQPVAYRVDAGPLSRHPAGEPVIANPEALARVASMFQVWEDVPTASIRYSYGGALLPAGAFPGGEARTADDLLDLLDSCSAAEQNPIIFDADGSMMAELLGERLARVVIGFAGACALDHSSQRISAGWAVMNGRFQDGVDDVTSGELTPAEFDLAFTHEFGHFSGLDHSQINLETALNRQVVNGRPVCDLDGLAGLPLMFPFLACQARADVGLPVLAPDDEAWISWLYPETGNDPANRQVPFASVYGILQGNILFSDGLTAVFDANVLARLPDNPATPEKESLRRAVSVVSGFRFTGWVGQFVTGTSPGSLFGSRDPRHIGRFEIPVPAGTYTVEVEAVFPGFVGGSGVGPALFHLPLPGPAEFWNADESDRDDPAAFTPVTVMPGQRVEGLDIILNGTLPPYDAFEGPDPPQAATGGAGLRRQAVVRR